MSKIDAISKATDLSLSFDEIVDIARDQTDNFSVVIREGGDLGESKIFMSLFGGEQIYF